MDELDGLCDTFMSMLEDEESDDPVEPSDGLVEPNDDLVEPGDDLVGPNNDPVEQSDGPVVAIIVRGDEDITPCYIPESLLQKHCPYYQRLVSFRSVHHAIKNAEKLNCDKGDHSALDTTSTEQENEQKVLELGLDHVEQGHLTYIVDWLHHGKLPGYDYLDPAIYWEEKRDILVGVYVLADCLGMSVLTTLIEDTCRSRYQQRSPVSWKGDCRKDLQLLDHFSVLVSRPLYQNVVGYAAVFLLHNRITITERHQLTDEPELPRELERAGSAVPPEVIVCYRDWYDQCQLVQVIRITAGDHITQEKLLKEWQHPYPWLA